MKTQDINKIINFNLTSILSSRGMSRTDLAEKIEMDRTVMFRRLQGNITLDTIAKVCTALEIKPVELFRELKLKK